MNREKKIELLRAQVDAVDPNGDVAELLTWKHQNEVVVRLVLGTDNPTYRKLVEVKFRPSTVPSKTPADYYVRVRRGGIRSSIALLKAAIGEVELVEPAPTSPNEAPGGTKVFVVHGHDDARKLEVAMVVHDLTGVKATILSDYHNGGNTIIEKFEKASNEAAFAIVIASADDLGGMKSEGGNSLSPRARQNVIFELGYFIAKLGRSRVALLVEQGIEIPSDAQGMVYIDLDPKGGWKLPLARELNGAGVAVDFQALAG